MNTKAWYTSKTLWFNALTVLAGALTALSGVQLSPEVASAVAVGISVVNFILRFFTNSAISNS